MEHCELLIIGAGAAGMSAAAAAWESGVRDLVLVDSASAPGGILRQCSHPGFGRAVFGTEKTGPDYAMREIRPGHYVYCTPEQAQAYIASVSQ